MLIINKLCMNFNKLTNTKFEMINYGLTTAYTERKSYQVIF